MIIGNNFYLAIFVVSVFVCGLQETFAQQETGKPPFVERASATVLVVDPDGSPVEGATVVPSGAVTTKMPSGEMSWMDDQPDLVKGLVTNEKGEVTLSWPKKLYEIFEPTNIRLRVNHSSFVAYSQRFSTGENPFKVVLERGFQAAVTAIDAASGEAIPKAELFARTNNSHSPDWTMKENGTLVSPVFGADENSFRLIQIAERKAVRFSDLIHVETAERSRFLYRDVKMHESVTLSGKLDEKVPRPIKNGHVVASAISIRDEDRPKYHTAWNWTVFGNVAEDGTFELAGLPPDTPLQIIAVCDGWTNEPLTDDEFNARFPSQKGNRTMFAAPQMVSDGQLSDVVVTMQPTATCKVKVVDEDGKPIACAIVARISHFVFFHGEMVSHFTPRNSSLEQILRIRNPDFSEATRAREIDEFESESAKDQIPTDENGIATLTNLSGPIIRSTAVHPRYRAESGQVYEFFRADLQSGKETEATVTLYKATAPERKEAKSDGDGK